MRIYDTLRRAMTPLEARDPGKVSIYVCGPTVQSEPHIGHGRSAVAFDVIRRYLRWRGYQVTYVRNITDIEDKIIAAAAESGEGTTELAERVAAQFAIAFEGLGVEPPDVEPKATEHIPQMLDLIGRLIDRGLAYRAGDDVYYSVRSLESYGRLSGQSPDQLLAGARLEISELKRDPLDFALWKGTKPGEPWWDSPWGAGRPGWHIECSAMAAEYLGADFDIHGGGTDLIFPHHENELAQSEGALGQTFARYWLHNGMVNLSGEKMSKSTGVIVDLNTAINSYGGMAVRLFCLRAHYRSPVEFSQGLLADAAQSYLRLDGLRRRAARPDVPPDQAVIDKFVEVMDEDFGTPEAVALLFDSLRTVNRLLDNAEEASAQLASVYEIADVLGLTDEPKGLEEVAVELTLVAQQWGIEESSDPFAIVEQLVARRVQARNVRDFAISDQIRDELAGLRIVVEDTADGARWFRR
jgi:cysteinyl-tRNA synthetase